MESVSGYDNQLKGPLNRSLDKVKYIPELDGLRALAVISVILFHMDLSPFIQGGFIGVDIFFVISGYVISRSLYAERETSFGAFLSTFYKKRMIRILPALLFCLMITMIAATLFVPKAWLSALNSRTGLSAFFGVSNFSLTQNSNTYFSPKGDFNPFLHTWSLGVEEQFYLIFPILFFLWLRFRKTNSPARAISAGLIPLLFAASFVLSLVQTGSHPKQAFYLLPSRFWEIAAGAILYMAHTRGWCRPTGKAVSTILFWTGTAALGMALMMTNRGAFPMPWAMLPVCGTLLIISAVTAGADASPVGGQILKLNGLAFVGRISYSLYLWHWPVIVLLRWTTGFESIYQKLLSLLLTIGLAMLSYYLIEKPIRLNRFIRQQKPGRVILAGLILLAGAFFGAKAVDKAQPVLSLSVTKDGYSWYPYRYRRDTEGPLPEYQDLNHYRLFVTGDSHTAAYRTMITRTAIQLGIETFEFEQGGAAICGLLKPMASLPDARDFHRDTIAQIKKQAKPGDLVFLASLRMPELSDQFEVIDLDEVINRHFSREAEEDRKAALEEASLVIKELDDLGILVLIDAPKPVLKAPPYRCSDWFNRNNPIGKPGTAIDRELLERLREPVMESLRILQERHDNLYIWDPFPVLCENENPEGPSLFFDGDHLSAHGNRVLAPSFLNRVVSIWRKSEFDS